MEKTSELIELMNYYINPNDPAVKPIIKKNENSDKSLGRELTKKFI